MDNCELNGILLRLKVLSMLRQHERVSTVGNKIIVDKPSLLQGIRRWIRGEDRDLNIEVIDQLIRRSIIYMQSTTDSFNQGRVRCELNRAKNGLVNLQTTYEHDSLAVARIGIITLRFGPAFSATAPLALCVVTNLRGGSWRF